MSKSLLSRLKEGILIADGAIGTMLLNGGLGTGECPEEWNVSHRKEVKAIHEAYLRAGCNLILTNTFGGNGFKLRRFGLENRSDELNLTGARIAKEAINQAMLDTKDLTGQVSDTLGGCSDARPIFVLGDVGPTGEFMEPVGSVKPEQFYQVFKEQILALIEGGIGAVIIETMSSLEECQTAVRAAKENTNLPVIVSMSFDPGKRGFRTMMGVDIRTMVKGLSESGADVIGTNCGGIGLEEMAEVIKEMRTLTDKPLMAQPNAGKPALVDGKTVYNESPETMAIQVKELVQAGANIIGGCCGTTPQHMTKISEAIRG